MKTMTLFETRKILRLEADVNYTIFHFLDGRKEVSSYTLKQYAAMPELSGFVRISRKDLINPTLVKEIKEENKVQFVVLLGGQQIRVSRRRKF